MRIKGGKYPPLQCLARMVCLRYPCFGQLAAEAGAVVVLAARTAEAAVMGQLGGLADDSLAGLAHHSLYKRL